MLGGLFFLDRSAAEDRTKRRRSTSPNAHARFRLFTGRDDQYERLCLVLLDASSSRARFDACPVGGPRRLVPWVEAADDLLSVTALRNPDFCELE